MSLLYAYLEDFYTNQNPRTTTGTDAPELLDGSDGSDEMFGGLGSDTLFGGSGNDILRGYLSYSDNSTSREEVARLTEADFDELRGGLGDDLYLLDSWVTNQPLIVEGRNEGIDSIFGDINGFVIPDNIENYINDLSIINRATGDVTLVEVTGNPSNNYISTYALDSDSGEHFRGLAGNDTFFGGGGNDRLDGGTGVDTAVYHFATEDYSVTRSEGDFLTISYTGPVIAIYPPPVTEGTDELISVERIQFSDKTVAFDFLPGESAFKSAMLVGAAFGNEYVSSYFSAGLSFFDLGRDTAYVCDLIVGAGLIEAQIGDASDRAWVKYVYRNVVGVDPDPLTELVLINSLASGQFTRSSLLAAAAELPLLEAQVDITGLQATGLAYTPFI